jgi:mannose-6-phosphate isomerase-like protein (cupin superfamily)
MKLRIWILGGAVILLSPAVTSAQAPTTATDITRAEWQAVRDSPDGRADRQVKVVDLGDTNVAVGILQRGRVENNGGPPRGIVHALVTEVYYITSGGGTLITGGTIVNATEPSGPDSWLAPVVGTSFNGEFEGGQVRTVSEGDLVVIPAGVMHGWIEVPDHVTYLSVRPDPLKALPAGYVNPAIQ